MSLKRKYLSSIGEDISDLYLCLNGGYTKAAGKEVLAHEVNINLDVLSALMQY